METEEQLQADVLEAMDALEEYREKGGQDAESWFAEHEAESGSGETANADGAPDHSYSGDAHRHRR